MTTRETQTTRDHAAPAPPLALDAQPALVIAFPAPAVVPLGAGTVVGRRLLADLGVADREISSEHLRLSRSGSSLFVEDLGSRNGTWLEGALLERGVRVPIGEGAVLRAGRTLLVYRRAFEGPLEPDPPLGKLVAPYGLRALRRALAQLALIGPRNVLLEGETGTGKELAASAVAAALGRADPYVALNIASVPAGVFESQLFGHVAGAFSDARAATKGVVLAHQGGAVFLDEIGELPMELQPKLLRLLENREVQPVGGDRPVTVDVLVLAATSRSLAERVADGGFREDLFARLAVARLTLSPLRERREDVFAIARRLREASGAPLEPEACEVEAVERLLLEPWPSNVRGLLGALTQAVLLDAEPGLRRWALDRVLSPAPARPPLSPSEVEAALEAAEGSEREAARRLGVSRGKLRRLRARK